MLGSRLSLNRLAKWIERRSWLVQLWLWALSCMRHRPTKYPKKRLLGKVIVSVDVAVGSICDRCRILVLPVYVRFAPKADQLQCDSELTLCANWRHHAVSRVTGFTA